MELNFILPFIVLLFGAFFSLIINNNKVLSLVFNFTTLFAFLFFALFLYFFINTPEVSFNYIFGKFSNEIGIEYTLNSFNIQILIFLSFLFFLFSVFFHHFVKNYQKEFSFNFLFCIIQIFCAASFAILMTNDLFNFYIFFELLAICAYIFTSLGGKGSSYSALNYLILGVVASGFIVLGIGFLYFYTGYLNITKVKEVLSASETNLLMPFLLILIGFLIKLAIFPFSFWQGLVYKSMPTPLLAVYSGTVALVTFYGFNIFFFSFFTKIESLYLVKDVIMILILCGVFLFAVFSLFELDVKKIFAYSTIAQVSYAIFMVFVLGGKGVYFSFLHLMFNSISKFILFVILFKIGGERLQYRINIFDGLITRCKFLALSVLFFLIGIIGMPLTFGFFTKFSFILTAFEGKSFLFIFTIIVGAILNFFYFWRIINVIFFNKREHTDYFEVNFTIKFLIIVVQIFLVISTIYFNSIVQYGANSFANLFIL